MQLINGDCVEWGPDELEAMGFPIYRTSPVQGTFTIDAETKLVTVNVTSEENEDAS